MSPNPVCHFPLKALRLLALGVCGFASATPALACDNGTAIITGGTNYPPLTWRQGDRLVGSTIDIVTQIFAEVGVKAVADEGGPWKRVLRRAEFGQVDVLLGVRHAAERESFLMYLQPAITPSVQGVFHAAEKPLAYERWKDLEGKSGSMTLGTNFNAEFDDYMKTNLSIQPVPKIEQNFMKLDKGRVDYMLGPLVPTQLYIQQFGFQGKIVSTEKPLMTIDEFVAISRKSSCMKHAEHVQKRIREYVESGKINEVMETYFVKWFEENSPPQ